MESRKMVLMNLCARQEHRHRCREQTCGHREERVGRTERYIAISTMPCVKQIASGKWLCSTGTQPSAVMT